MPDPLTIVFPAGTLRTGEVTTIEFQVRFRPSPGLDRPTTVSAERFDDDPAVWNVEVRDDAPGMLVIHTAPDGALRERWFYAVREGRVAVVGYDRERFADGRWWETAFWGVRRGEQVPRTFGGVPPEKVDHGRVLEASLELLVPGAALVFAGGAYRRMIDGDL